MKNEGAVEEITMYQTNPSSPGTVMNFFHFTSASSLSVIEQTGALSEGSFAETLPVGLLKVTGCFSHLGVYRHLAPNLSPARHGTLPLSKAPYSPNICSPGAQPFQQRMNQMHDSGRPTAPGRSLLLLHPPSLGGGCTLPRLPLQAVTARFHRRSAEACTFDREGKYQGNVELFGSNCRVIFQNKKLTPVLPFHDGPKYLKKRIQTTNQQSVSGQEEQWGM
ncbi:unnamed protein product [Pleuronectes platessa]|uniref:Uncharacterized protein n=1 Tax=Pleuronectes platessa TaxID=8262 RepID=A0A9N7Z4G8_PLEPL|nr:unnamed protein product [Pleuronectes platessa]